MAFMVAKAHADDPNPDHYCKWAGCNPTGARLQHRK